MDAGNNRKLFALMVDCSHLSVDLHSVNILATLLALLTLFLSSQTCCLEGQSHCDDRELSNENCSDQPEKQLQCLPFFSCGACSGFTPSQYNNFLSFFAGLLPPTQQPNLSQWLSAFIPTELIKPPSF